MANADNKKETTTKRRKKRSQKVQKMSLNFKSMVKDVKKPLLFVGGLYAGKQVAILIDKNSQTVQGVLGIDGAKLVKPVVLGLVGLGLSQVLKDPNLKMVAMGVAAYGAIVAVKEFIGEDILSGIGDNAQLPSNGTQPKLPKNVDIDLKEFEDIVDEIDNEIKGDGNGSDKEDYTDYEEVEREIE